MLLLSVGGEPPFHQAFLADAERIRELSAALSALRATLEHEPIERFFARYAEPHQAAERALSLTVSSRKWQARWLEVKDFLKARMPSDWSGRRDGDSVVIRKLGWVKLDRELGRARALLRIGAPDSAVADQRERVRQAYLATGWNEQHAPPAAVAPDVGIWARLDELEADSRMQVAWSHAQELVERGLELCIPPLSDPVGLGGHATLDAPGEPLLDPRTAAHPGWVEPTWLPSFRIGQSALELEHAVHPKSDASPSPEVVDQLRARFASALRQAAEESQALVWWLDPAW